MGAPTSLTGTLYGKAFVYLGAATGLATSPTWTAGSGQAVFSGYAGYFGASVASAGDLNGDGFDDVVVGESQYTDGHTYEGRAYAYFGEAGGVSSTIGWSLESDRANAGLGGSVGGAGDINADGYADLLVSGPGYPASLFLGSATGPASASTWTTDFYRSSSAASAGDVNGDGYADVIVGGINAAQQTAVAVYTGYGEICYVDADGDGDGSSATLPADSTGCTNPGEAPTGTDCDDTDVAVHPLATEVVADGVDNDCDGSERCYSGTDADGDGYYAATLVLSADLDCSDSGESATGDDCDDGNAGASPSQAELVADTIDQDCDGYDNCYADTDGDSYGSAALVVTADFDCADAGESWVNSDCDDGSAATYPGAAETPADAIDSDCDNGDLCYLDGDYDGTGSTTTVTSPDMDCAGTGEATLASDCNDDDATISPGAAEWVADTIDQDCDTHELCFLDNDRDGFGSASTTPSVDLDCADLFEAAAADDCDDTLSTTHPGGTEAPADSIDSDCDGGDLCHADSDDDGVGAAETVASPDMDCSGPGESGVATDCDSTVATVYPGAPEVAADAIDQDCDGGDRCFEDLDRDTYGTATTVASVDLDCSGSLESAVATDCDDLLPSAYPGAAEVTADGVDQDCDGGDVCFVDADADTFGAIVTVGSVDLNCVDAGESGSSDDCDDTAATTYPDAPEATANGVDDDCDGLEACYADGDGDGYGTAAIVASDVVSCAGPGLSTANTDCNDADPAFHPGAVELVADAADQDCDGAELCYVDIDGDGYGVETTTPGDLSCTGAASVAWDCDDANANVHPAAVESAADGLDQDCDGTELCFADADRDGYGDQASMSSADLDCWDAGESPVPGDCDDQDVRVRPHARETPANGVDEDCDGRELCLVDGDGDGFGSSGTEPGELACSLAGADCDDDDASVAPGAVETCNRLDDDCDGQVDEGLHCNGEIPLLGCTTAGSPALGVVGVLLSAVGMEHRRRRLGVGATS